MPQFPPIQTFRCPAKPTSRLAVALAFLSAGIAAALAQTNPPVITSSTNTLGTVGQPFGYTITASGGATNFGASSLPQGILPPASGSANITGLPQAAGTFASTISAANAAGTTSTNLSIQVNPPASPSLASPVTVFGVQGQPLNYALRSVPNHSNVPTTFSVSGLPLGATLISNVTTNTPYTNVLVTNYFINSPSLLTNGSFVVPVIVSNQGGASTNNVTFIINPTNVPQFTTNSNTTTAFVGVPFSYDVFALNAPLRFRVTNIEVVGVSTNPVSITNGPLINGFSFSNVTIGGNTFARIYGTPGQTNEVKFGLEAANNFGSSTNAITNTNYTLVIKAQNAKPTVTLSQPLAEARYVLGSSFYLNAQVFNDPEDALVPSSFAFTSAGDPVQGTVGIYGDYFGIQYYPEAGVRVLATAQNVFGVTKSSGPLDMQSTVAQNPLPTIEMLPLNFGQQLVAGGKVILSARATIPSTRVNIDRVEFYVNKVYVGSSSAPEPDTDGVYEYEWTTPTTPDSFQVTARAISLNFTSQDPPPANITVPNVPVWASVIARKPTIVNTKQGTAPSVAITSPANNGNLTIGVANRIQATALLAGGAIQSVEFFANGQRIVSSTGTTNPDTQVPFEVDFVPNSFGAYELYAIATGSNGLQTVSPVVIANAPSGFVPTVTIDSPAYDTEVPFGSPLVIAYTAQDSDGFVRTLQLLVNGAVVDELDSQADGLIGNGFIPYTPPSQGAYEFVIRITDNQGNSGQSTPVRVTVKTGAVNPAPLVVLSPTVPVDGAYVIGSQFFYNANVTPRGGASIPDTGVSFFFGGVVTAGAPSGVPSGQGFFAARGQLQDEGQYNGYATSTDSSGNIGLSGRVPITVAAPKNPLPVVEMLALNPGTTVSAGGQVLLRAKALFPSTTPYGRRVEFYANGAFLGSSTVVSETDPDVYTLLWKTPTTPRSFQIDARAVAGNEWSIFDDEVRIFSYGSSLSEVPTTISSGTSAIPVVSIKSPLEGTSVPVGQAITIQSTASIVGSTIARMDYYANGDFIGSSATGADSYSIQYTPISKGELTLYAIAVSAKGFEGQSNPVKINVPLTGDPAIQFLSPSDGVTFPPGTTFTAAAEASINPDTQAPIQNVRFFLNEVLVGTDDAAPYSQQVTLRGVGNYFLKAIVTDIFGSTASVQQLVVCASPSSGSPPIISMTHPTPGGGGDVVNDFSTPSQFFFNALITLPSGVSVAPGGVKFFANGVPVEGTVSNIGYTYSIFWQPDRNGDYNITAQVTDSRGITGVSEPLFFEIAPVVRPLPSIALLPPPSATATVGSRLLLQAVTNGSITPVARIDFYANGVLIGSREVNDPANGTDTTTIFEWTPTVAGAYTLSARAIQVLGETGDNSVISNGQDVTVAPSAGSTPIVIISPQPIAEARYVLGSEVFLNATVTPRGGATIPTNGVSFFFGNYGSQQALASGVFSGSQQFYTGRQSLTDIGQSTIFATAQDSRNTTGVSSVYTLTTSLPLYPLPSVEMYPILQEDDDGVFTPDEPVQLQARAIFPSTANQEARVEFYANGAYLGAGTPGDPASTTGNTDPNIYTFDWVVPRTPGVFAIESRAVALNFETKVANDNLVRNFASVIAPNSEIMDVQAATVYPPNTWNPNEAFVYNIYQAILYRPPTKSESAIAVAQLAAGTTRSAFVMALMGYDTGAAIFNRLRDYSLTTAMAFSAYARLGLTPTDGIANDYGQQDFITRFIDIIESDNTPVGPIPLVYSGVPDAPWTATKGLARAFQNRVFNSLAFSIAYSGVTAKSNKDFSAWLSQVMFPSRSAGGVDEIQLVSMMTQYNPNQNRQGAAAAFRSAFAAVNLASGYDPTGSGLEKTFQRQLASAILEFQLAAQNPDPTKRVSWATAWANGQKNAYSQTVVQSLLTKYTGAGSTVRSFTPASYQGLFGPAVSPALSVGRLPRSRSTLPAPSDIGGEIRVSVSASGAYSAVLTTGSGAVYRYGGKLRDDGSITDSWAPGVFVQLEPADAGEAKYLGGTVTLGSSAPQNALAGQLVYSTQNPIPNAGNYTMSLVIDPEPAASDRLQGSGFAKVIISRAGSVMVSGRLADNTPLTASFPVWGATGQDGPETIFVHRALKNGAGSISGVIARNSETGSLGVGELVWRTPASAIGPRRDVVLSTSLSPFLRSSSSVLPANWPWNADFSLDWGDGSSGQYVSGAVAFRQPGTLHGSAAGLNLQINRNSGLVSGSFLDSATGRKYRVRGVLDQAQGLIDGFFLTPSASGALEVNR